VTGASGFVGSCAVRRLLAAGHSVHLLLRDQARLWRLEGVLRHPRVEVARTDLADAEAVRRAVADARADVVVHLATEGAYEHQSDARRILTMNILGTHNLLEASTEAGVRLFVNAGSSSEYGYKDHPMREDEVLQPNSHYAVAKAAQTHLVALASRTCDFAAATFRLFSVYGPWEEPTRLVPTLIRRARAGQPLVMTAPETARDFVYVDDVLDVLLGFDRLTHLRGEVFNVGSGVQSTLRHVVAVIQKEIGARSEVRWGDMPPRRWDTAIWCADPTASLDALGWLAKIDLAAGVRKMARWMMEVGDDYGPHTISA
jgi:nucleoside-diphosphate-sugar epimerase